MGQDKFELFVKDKIGDYQSPIDTDQLWAGIQNNSALGGATVAGSASTLTSNVATIAIWKWMIGSLFVVSMVGAGVWLTSSSVAADESTHSTQSNLSTPIDYLSADQTVAGQLDLNSATSGTSDSRNITEVVSSADQENNPVTSQSKENSVAVDKRSPIEQHISIETNIPASQNNQSNDQSFGNDVPPTSDILAFGNENENNNRNTPITVDEPKESEVSSQDFGTSQNEIAESKDLTKNNVTPERTALEVQYLAPYKHELATKDFNLDMQLPDKITCPQFGDKRKGMFGVELQLIPLYSSPRFKALDAAGEEWKELRLATESYLEAFQINLLARYHHGSGVYVHAGIGYGQIDEKLEYNTQDYMEVVVDTVTIIIIRPDGSRDTTRGPVAGEEENSLDARTFNYHRMIELPCALGYEHQLNPYMAVYFDVGGSLSLAVYRKGYVAIDGEAVSFDSTSQPVYRTTTGFKVKSSLGLKYYLDNGISLSAGPEIRYHTGNWLRDELTLEQRYLDIGVRFAVGYNF